KHRRGFSLIEFMVAAALGLLVLLGISRVFVAARVGYGLSEAKSRMQENARLAVESIQRDVRMAGHMGCVNDGARMRNNEWFVHLPGTSNVRSFAGADFSDQFARAVEGFEANGSAPGASLSLTGALGGGWTPALPTALQGRVAQGSDVLVVRYLGPTRARVTAFTPNASGARVTVDTTVTGPIQAGKTYALADCNQVSFFTAASVGGGGTTLVATDVGGAEYYSPSTAYLYETTTVAYYVGAETNGRLGLFRHVMTRGGAAPTEVLVPGVLSFQVLYGWDSNEPMPDGAIDREGTGAALASATVAGGTAHSRIGQVRAALLLSEEGPRAGGSDPNRSRPML
ncbi:MAG: hypothetical protein DI568_18280, partial [Sphingomonas sp.]